MLFLAKYSRWHCRAKHSSPEFTLKTQTFMEDSPIGLDKWLIAMWQIVNCENGISSCELAKNIGVTQKTAWFMPNRIRFGMRDRKHGGGKLGGRVEVDETFIGGKARNMHVSRRGALGALATGDAKPPSWECLSAEAAPVPLLWPTGRVIRSSPSCAST